MKYTFEQFNEANEKSHSSRQDFVKHILTTASGMLAILAAFHTSGTNTGYIPQFYLSTLALLTIGIISGGLNLYFDTVATKSVFTQLKNEMQKQLENPLYAPKQILYNPPKLFYISQNLCYITLLLSVIFLAIYSSLK
jgi:hypothetical protein